MVVVSFAGGMSGALQREFGARVNFQLLASSPLRNESIFFVRRVIGHGFIAHA
eukprot:CAMPEP_0194308226 /NCGR_PEP_ID=MMETSP0171-20130528/5188_1 /TAXON_ID=218684 /ORGANISM="Corethron pennatum, Strain L29A3" /LENGTH=52 /DNA_ID=CAMNT_0039060751 /DNA_START=405 /DNA_END=559 /DNA_ORIENTATION=+